MSDKDLSQTDKLLLHASTFIKPIPEQTETDKLLAKLSDVYIDGGGDLPMDNGYGYESRVEREGK